MPFSKWWYFPPYWIYWIFVKWVNSSKRIAVSTIVLLAIGLLISIFVVPISLIYPVHTVYSNPVLVVEKATIPNQGTMSFAFKCEFSAQNSFSVDNPISVKVVIYNITATGTVDTANFLKYVKYVGFTGATIPNNNTVYLTGEQAYPLIPLTAFQTTTGIEYQTQTTKIIFQNEGPSWFVPYSYAFNPQTEVGNNTIYEQGKPAITISGISLG